MKPLADISVIPAAGDKDTDGKVRFSGINASDSFTARMMDSMSRASTLGVQAEKGDFSFGLNYDVQASSHETDQNLQFRLGWKLQERLKQHDRRPWLRRNGGTAFVSLSVF